MTDQEIQNETFKVLKETEVTLQNTLDHIRELKLEITHLKLQNRSLQQRIKSSGERL